MGEGQPNHTPHQNLMAAILPAVRFKGGKHLTMTSVLVTSVEDAVLRAKLLLAGTPAENGPFSVEVEQDYFIVRVTADAEAGTAGFEVLVDVFNGSASYCTSAVIDVALQVPKD